MHLGGRKARHLDLSEVIVFGIMRGPSLDVLAGVGAAVEGGRTHNANPAVASAIAVVSGLTFSIADWGD
jgi:hypothetical protein